MWKVTIIVPLLTAFLVGYLGPDAVYSLLQQVISSVPSSCLSVLHTLTEATQHLIAPLVRFFSLGGDSAFYSPETGSGPFELPKCLRNPLAESQLKEHTHIGLLGHVFDVSENDGIYGGGGAYAYLTGRDVTRLLVSKESDAKGGFALEGLTSSQLYELGDWLKFYARKYHCVGHLPGVYFSPMGDHSEYLLELFEAWNKNTPENIDFADVLPPCTSFFDGKTLRLSCNLYGSVDEENPEGVHPRQLLEPEKATLRCACVPASLLSHGRLRQYPNCPPAADHCLIPIDDAETVWTGRLSPPDAG